jgi:hypothetical protein
MLSCQKEIKKIKTLPNSKITEFLQMSHRISDVDSYGMFYVDECIQILFCYSNRLTGVMRGERKHRRLWSHEN